MSLPSYYYIIKPFLPRRFQLATRRLLAARKRKQFTNIWPVYPNVTEPPVNWTGWPEQKKFALILCHDVDTERGYSRCNKLMKMEEDLGFRSSFNFVPEDYAVSPELRIQLRGSGFEVGVHGLTHDGRLFSNRKIFELRAPKIDKYLKDWGAVGFYSPAMYRNMEWIAELNIEYACSTFDSDPFEPQPNNVWSLFPIWIWNNARGRGYVELPYTLPQDHCLFAILREKNIKIWLEKLDWVARKGGMVRLNTHPDYMNFDKTRCSNEEYPAQYYGAFLEHIRKNYKDQYWHVLPRKLASFWKDSVIGQSDHHHKY
jgi:hypothetical protein